MAKRSPPEDEQGIVCAARDGDRQAFSELYQRYRRAVHAVALSRVAACDAGDVVQDTFVIAMRQLRTLRNPEAFGGWLLTIARNRATDVVRRRKPTSEWTDEIGEHRPPTAEAAQMLRAIRA